jgi:hypothetical protein
MTQQIIHAQGAWDNIGPNTTYNYNLVLTPLWENDINPCVHNYDDLARELTKGGYVDSNHQLALDGFSSITDTNYTDSYGIRSIYMQADGQIFCNVIHWSDIVITTNSFGPVYSVIV